MLIQNNFHWLNVLLCLFSYTRVFHSKTTAKYLDPSLCRIPLKLVLQIRRGNWDNLRIIIHISQLKHIS